MTAYATESRILLEEVVVGEETIVEVVIVAIKAEEVATVVEVTKVATNPRLHHQSQVLCLYVLMDL